MDAIFGIKSELDFESKALEAFYFQYEKNKVYHEFCAHLRVDPEQVKCSVQIPFLPIHFFKSRKIVVEDKAPEIVFSSSGTTGTLTSKHFVSNLTVYENSFLKAFELFYGSASDYCVLGLLPSYLERKGSSLIYMVDDLIAKSSHPDSGFYLKNTEELAKKLRSLEASKTKTLLIGVSFALLDLAEVLTFPLKHTIVMETGGMKGRRKEMIRSELHNILRNAFKVPQIHSEYGMTELLSQAYSKENGIFHCPPWMKIITRDTEDPLSLQKHNKTGGINVIDLANINSCPFIATQDLGKTYSDGSFEVLGRFDHADVRGCNLMAL